MTISPDPLSLMRREADASRPARVRSVGRFTSVAVVAVALVVGGCGHVAILPDEAFRNVIPANAQLQDETTDDGASLIEDGERLVLRTFTPVPPAKATDVLTALVDEGERDGWVFTEETATRAVGTKDIDGWPWMVSLTVRDGSVRQLFAGR